MYVLGKLNTYNNIDNTYIITTYIYNQTIYLETVLKTKRWFQMWTLYHFIEHAELWSYLMTICTIGANVD